MKNALTPSQDTAQPRPPGSLGSRDRPGGDPAGTGSAIAGGAVSEPWRAALRTVDADLQRRGAAERTRRAYGTHAAELAAWATANQLAPQELDYKALRRWAARLSQKGAAPRTMARKLASTRSLFRSLLEHGEVASNPANLLPAPKLPHTLPKTLK